jgi:Na+/proline symporter
MRLRQSTIFRLAGLGALAVSVGLAVAYLLFWKWVSPSGAGIDRTEAAVARIAVGSIVVALIVVHVVFGRVLLNLARTAEAR